MSEETKDFQNAIDNCKAFLKKYQTRYGYGISVKRYNDYTDIETLVNQSDVPGEEKENLIEEMTSIEHYQDWLDSEYRNFTENVIIEKKLKEKKFRDVHFENIQFSLEGRMGGWFIVNNSTDIERVIEDLESEMKDSFEDDPDNKALIDFANFEVELLTFILNEAEEYNKNMSYKKYIQEKIAEVIRNEQQ